MQVYSLMTWAIIIIITNSYELSHNVLHDSNSHINFNNITVTWRWFIWELIHLQFVMCDGCMTFTIIITVSIFSLTFKNHHKNALDYLFLRQFPHLQSSITSECCEHFSSPTKDPQPLQVTTVVLSFTSSTFELHLSQSALNSFIALLLPLLLTFRLKFKIFLTTILHKFCDVSNECWRSTENLF